MSPVSREVTDDRLVLSKTHIVYNLNIQSVIIEMSAVSREATG